MPGIVRSLLTCVVGVKSTWFFSYNVCILLESVLLHWSSFLPLHQGPLDEKPKPDSEYLSLFSTRDGVPTAMKFQILWKTLCVPISTMAFVLEPTYALHARREISANESNGNNTALDTATTTTKSATPVQPTDISNPGHPECWSWSETHTPRPVVPSDCSDALDQLASMPLPDKPRVFTTWAYQDDNRQWRHSVWIHASCSIYVKSVHAQAIDEFSFWEVVIAARFVQRICVLFNPVKVGGWIGIRHHSRGFMSACLRRRDWQNLRRGLRMAMGRSTWTLRRTPGEVP